MTQKTPKWYSPGDLNAFFGLMLDNVADLILTVSLLALVFEFPTTFSLRYMAPGTAIGVLVGDLLFFAMALGLARRTGRGDITAMPLGLDTPSTFGMVFFVLGPAFTHAKLTLNVHEAAIYTWEIGICAIFVSGLFKFACAFGSSWIRKVVPRAGLLGSLAAIALVIISFLPLLEVFHLPIVGFISLAVILATLVARIDLPLKIPGALGALLAGGAIYYLMFAADHFELIPGFELLPPQASDGFKASDALLPYEWTGVFSFHWVQRLNDLDFLQYVPIVIPFALATVVGGIDCTESAAAAGDEFDTGQIIGVEAIATLAASLCGGVIQTTPYIGHPAYKAMGGRSAYTLMTALFIGSAGLLGYFGYLYEFIPKPTVFPILVFIGLEITSQSFHATPRRHFPAVALACVPALAYLVDIFADQLTGAVLGAGYDLSRVVQGQLADNLLTVQMLSAGFIVTSLLWASALAAIIDRRLRLAALYFALGAVGVFFGVIHSPLADGSMYLPWRLEEAGLQAVVYRFALGYLAAAVVFLGWSFMVRPDDGKNIDVGQDSVYRPET